MRELWFVAPKKLEIRDAELRAPSAGELVVRGLASAVGQGTELLLYRGHCGPRGHSGPRGHRAHRGEGDAASAYPRRCGDAWVGETESGTRVFARAPHGDAHVLREEDVRTLPKDLAPARATLASSLEAALTCAWDSEVAFADRVLVLGGGLVGVLTAWLLARSGAKVSLVEPRRARREAVRALAPSVVLGDVPDGSADVVVEASGDPRALDVAATACATGGRIVVASLYGTRPAPLDLGERFHRRGLELRTTDASRMPPRLTARWDADRRFDVVVDLLADPALDHLLAPPIPFARAAQLYASLDGNADVPPAHVFVYR